MIHGFQRPMTEWSDCTLNSTPTSIVEYPLLHITVSSRQLQLGSPTSTSRTKDFLYYSTDLNNGSSDPVQLSLPCSWDLERHTYLPTERAAWVESHLEQGQQNVGTEASEAVSYHFEWSEISSHILDYHQLCIVKAAATQPEIQDSHTQHRQDELYPRNLQSPYSGQRAQCESFRVSYTRRI